MQRTRTTGIRGGNLIGAVILLGIVAVAAWATFQTNHRDHELSPETLEQIEWLRENPDPKVVEEWRREIEE